MDELSSVARAPIQQRLFVCTDQQLASREEEWRRISNLSRFDILASFARSACSKALKIGVDANLGFRFHETLPVVVHDGGQARETALGADSRDMAASSSTCSAQTGPVACLGVPAGSAGAESDCMHRADARDL